MAHVSPEITYEDAVRHSGSPSASSSAALPLTEPLLHGPCPAAQLPVNFTTKSTERVCCADIPSYLWFLKSSWSENELEDAPAIATPSKTITEQLGGETIAEESILISETPLVELMQPTFSSANPLPDDIHTELGRNLTPPPSPQRDSAGTPSIASPASPSTLSDSVRVLQSPGRRSSNSFTVKSSLPYSPDMFEVIPSLNLSGSDSDKMMATSAEKGNRGAIIGWQIEIADPSGAVSGVRVVAGMKKSWQFGGKTLFLVLSADDYTPHGKSDWDKPETWVLLKRGKGKSGLPFKLLRQVARFEASAE